MSPAEPAVQLRSSSRSIEINQERSAGNLKSGRPPFRNGPSPC